MVSWAIDRTPKFSQNPHNLNCRIPSLPHQPVLARVENGAAALSPSFVEYCATYSECKTYQFPANSSICVSRASRMITYPFPLNPPMADDYYPSKMKINHCSPER